MARKSNKTSHVLNLLSGSDVPEEHQSDTSTSSSNTTPRSAEPPTNISIIDTSDSGNDAIADLINEKLREVEDAPEQVLEDGIEMSTISTSDEGSVPSNFAYVNVMEYIVKDMVNFFASEFGMCTCDRCIIDTTALALSNLPPKYIVKEKQAVPPLLNYYSNKLIVQVTVELTKACTIVKDHPHH